MLEGKADDKVLGGRGSVFEVSRSYMESVSISRFLAMKFTRTDGKFTWNSSRFTRNNGVITRNGRDKE